MNLVNCPINCWYQVQSITIPTSAFPLEMIEIGLYPKQLVYVCNVMHKSKVVVVIVNGAQYAINYSSAESIEVDYVE